MLRKRLSTLAQFTGSPRKIKKKKKGMPAPQPQPKATNLNYSQSLGGIF